jgi:hypothetical protein
MEGRPRAEHRGAVFHVYRYDMEVTRTDHPLWPLRVSERTTERKRGMHVARRLALARAVVLAHHAHALALPRSPAHEFMNFAGRGREDEELGRRAVSLGPVRQVRAVLWCMGRLYEGRKVEARVFGGRRRYDQRGKCIEGVSMRWSDEGMVMALDVEGGRGVRDR